MGGKVSQPWRGSGGKWNFRVTFTYLTDKFLVRYKGLAAWNKCYDDDITDHWTLMGNPTPEIQWYLFQPPTCRVTPTLGSVPHLWNSGAFRHIIVIHKLWLDTKTELSQTFNFWVTTNGEMDRVQRVTWPLTLTSNLECVLFHIFVAKKLNLSRIIYLYWLILILSQHLIQLTG